MRLGPPRLPGDHSVVVGGEGGNRVSSLGDRDPALDVRELAADALDGLGKGRVEDNGLRIGVVEQVDELVGHIAVVGVHRR